MGPATRAAVAPQDLRQVVADFLRVDPGSIDATVPLTAYGIDSLAALELVAELEDRFGRTLPESLLADCPDLERLAGALADRDEAAPSAGRGTLEELIADGRLPDDIRPWTASPPRAIARTVLLTGATGFLGSSLLRSLVDTGLHVVCLVRAAEGNAVDRLRRNLDRYDLARPGDDERYTAIVGDIERPWLGLPFDRYTQLTIDVDVVYHAAAHVNWVSAYEALRSANVDATTALLRFASTGIIKPFHFVSSLSACLAAGGPPVVSEKDDLLSCADRLPLGYAQSKCVAESLVRNATRRGLPAAIYRPALLAGHSISGASNPDDLICALLKGCIQMGTAPDLDWTFDALPVDSAADAIVRLGRSPASRLETFHLRHPRPRHWRECVLWINLFGYHVRLEPYDAWLRRLAWDARDSGHALHRLRAFFTRTIHGRTAPEHFEEQARSRIDCTSTRVRERKAGIAYPALDAPRLDSYLSDLVMRGFLPRPPAPASRDSAPAMPDRWLGRLEPLLRRHFRDPELHVAGIDVVSRGSEHSIISELTSWKRQRQTGLAHCAIDMATASGRRHLDVMVKVKPPDEDVIEVAETAAAVVGEQIQRELALVRDRIGIRGSHLRELAVYGMRDPRFARYLPACYGTWRNDAEGSWGLLLEHLDDVEVMDASDDTAAWTHARIVAAIDGLAELHAVWLGRERELLAEPWIGHVMSTPAAVKMAPFWTALAVHAGPMFSRWAGQSVTRHHEEMAATAGSWWPAMEWLPKTLIHHDFNSRNIAIRRTPEGPRLVVFDWELATVGAPQRDLAELLCFTLPPGVHADVVDAWVERHRTQLERQSGRRLEPDLWRAGFAAALADLLVSRLAFYALIHRIRPQAFLPRVVAVWGQLFDMWGPPVGGP